MGFVDIGGHRLEIDRIEGPPHRPTLVFLHEGLGCIARWRDFPRAVATAAGCPALVYSRLGYGQSDPVARPRPVTFMHDEARGDLPALLESEGLTDVILIGHSDGASIALIHASDGDRRVRGLVTMAPHVFVEDICVHAIHAIRTQYLDDATDVKKKLAKHHADVDGAFLGWADVWLAPAFRSWNLTGLLPSVKVPLLVIQGEDDEYGTLAQVDAVCAGVSGPSERLVLSACGHVPQRDRLEEVLAAIVGFVQRIRGA
ncbi:benzoate degradation ring-cleavage hydrolase [Minicystis rosea]|nr:benzoate degradation ring-cleavage hydrolase [Minicystis rosea]